MHAQVVGGGDRNGSDETVPVDCGGMTSFPFAVVASGCLTTPGAIHDAPPFRHRQLVNAPLEKPQLTLP